MSAMASIQQRNLPFLAMVLISTSPAAVLLPAPSISINPVGEVTWGQSVNITCAISTSFMLWKRGHFILEGITGSFRESKRSKTNSATFSIVKVDFDNEGLYQCWYQLNTRQKYPRSDSVRLSVTVPLQQPHISLTSPNSGLLWGPGGAEVTRGYEFAFTCSINSSFSEGCFFLIFSGSNLNNSKPAVNHSATFTFPVAEYEHQGNYSCVYEVSLSSRRFMSTQNESVSLIIKMPLLPLVSSVVAGGLVVLMLVLVVICLAYKRRRKAPQPGFPIQSQMAVRVRNSYEEDTYGDEDNDYENVHPMNTKKNLKEKSGNRYVEDLRVQKNRQEEEEESSDDEADYENVSRPYGEQNVGIHGQHEDIYQNL